MAHYAYKHVVLTDTIKAITYGITAISSISGVVLAIEGCNTETDMMDQKKLEYAESLKEISIPSDVTSIGHNFFKYFPNLETLTIPATVTDIDPIAFLDTPNLSKIEVKYGNKNYYSKDNTLMDHSDTIIRGSTYRKDYVYHARIPIDAKKIGSIAFAKLPDSTVINLSDSHISSISNNAFSGNRLTIIMPENITSCSMTAFNDCPNLNLIVYNNNFSFENDSEMSPDTLTPSIVYAQTLLDKAKCLYEDQLYKEAIDMVEIILNYKDCLELKTDCLNHLNYDEGKSLYEEHHYNEAIDKFKKNVEFKDSKKYLCQALYYEAKKLCDQRNYFGAKKPLSEIYVYGGGNNDTDFLMKKCDRMVKVSNILESMVTIIPWFLLLFSVVFIILSYILGGIGENLKVSDSVGKLRALPIVATIISFLFICIGQLKTRYIFSSVALSISLTIFILCALGL